MLFDEASASSMFYRNAQKSIDEVVLITRGTDAISLCIAVNHFLFSHAAPELLLNVSHGTGGVRLGLSLLRHPHVRASELVHMVSFRIIHPKSSCALLLLNDLMRNKPGDGQKIELTSSLVQRFLSNSSKSCRGKVLGICFFVSHIYSWGNLYKIAVIKHCDRLDEKRCSVM